MYNQNLLKGSIVVILLLVLSFGTGNILLSQTARNPVIEFCTGTW